MDAELKTQLDRIEAYAKIAAKSVLTLTEASFILGMGEQTVRMKVRNHEIPAYKPNVNRLYFKKDELEAWMLQNRSKSMTEIESEAIKYCITH
jgi:prophage regulatory protein